VHFGDLSPLIDFLVRGACVLFVLLLVFKGPARVVKIGVVVFTLGFVGLISFKAGWMTGATVVGVILASNVVAMSVGTLFYRQPLQKALLPVDREACPRYARQKVEQWSRGFEGLGYEPYGEGESRWSLGKSQKKTYTRFLLHRSRHSWVEIHALEEPRMVARMIASVKEGGRSVSTCDQQANEELFRDDRTLIQRVASRSSCADMVASHELFLLKIPGSLETVTDPMTLHQEIYNGWVERLLASGQVVRRGDSMAIPLRSAFPISFRVLAAWFH
jgi:hypothetical protein